MHREGERLKQKRELPHILMINEKLQGDRLVSLQSFFRKIKLYFCNFSYTE